jgi:hypothetical protein
MERDVLELHVLLAEQHVRLGEEHLRRQRDIIAKMENGGDDATLARQLLASMGEVAGVAHRPPRPVAGATGAPVNRATAAHDA